MKLVKMKNNVAVIPNDWIILNPEKACEYDSCGVTEVRNSHLIDGVPHYLFFTNARIGVGSDLTEDMINEINKEILKVCPKFQKVLDTMVDPPSVEEVAKNPKVADPHLKNLYPGYFMLQAFDFNNTNIDNYLVDAFIIVKK